jgi:hypothetical protein
MIDATANVVAIMKESRMPRIVIMKESRMPRIVIMQAFGVGESWPNMHC